MELLPPFDTFKIEKHAGEYKDFGTNSDYPLKGVTYPVDYGDIQGYIAEDGANLDLFVGNSNTIDNFGYIKVFRPELTNGEHKIYIHMTDEDESAMLKEFEPVLIAHGRYETTDALLAAIEQFRTR
jgi:hypothetical protein